MSQIKFIQKVLLILYFILCQHIFCQILDSNRSKTELKNLIGISIGLSDFHVREEMASPLTYRNIGITASLEYIRLGDNYRHHIELTGYYTKLKSIYEKFDALNGRAGLRYNYLHKILDLNASKNLKLYAGGGLYSFITSSHYEEHSIFETYTAADTWYLSHNAEISVLLENIINNSNHFTLQVYFPVISNVSRPAYSAIPGSDTPPVIKLFGITTIFWDNTIVQLKMRYNRKLNTWLSLFIYYDFQYFSYSEPRKIVMYMNNFRAGTNFLF